MKTELSEIKLENIHRCRWQVAAYGGSVTTGEPKFYAVKSSNDTIASDVATYELAWVLSQAPKMWGALFEILVVATGEQQVSNNDTEALEWIANRIKNLHLDANSQNEPK